MVLIAFLDGDANSNVISGWPEGEGGSGLTAVTRLLDFEGLPPNMSVISHELVALEQQQRFRPT